MQSGSKCPMGASQAGGDPSHSCKVLDRRTKLLTRNDQQSAIFSLQPFLSTHLPIFFSP